MSTGQSGGKASQNKGDLAPPLLLLDDFASDLSAELRKQTFFDVIRGRSSATQLPDTIRQISLSELPGTSSKEQHLVVSVASPIGTCAPTFVEKVQNLDIAEVGSEGAIKKEQCLFNQFISAIAAQVLFEFRDTGSFHDFANCLIPWLEHEKDLCTKLHLRLHVFYDAEDFASMNEIKRTILPHGYEENARDHFSEWIEALQTVIEAAKVCHIEIEVDLILHRPYLDYLVIRTRCNLVFRQETVGDLGSTIKLNMLCVDTAPWSELLKHPEADDIEVYHTLLACSIFGTRLLEPVRECLEGNFERLERLVDYGCLGIRE